MLRENQTRFIREKRLIIIAPGILLLLAGGWWYRNRAELRVIQFVPGNVRTGSGAFSYEPYASALARYVNERSLVHYPGLKADRGNLDSFAASLSNVKPELFDSWSDREKTAFWINAYNALTLEAIIRNYPIESSLVRSFVYPKNSIRQIPGVWDKLRFVILGREMSLNDIEHGTLRAKFNEPRVHVALVCAALSCPPLRREPYTGEQLDRQLEDQARAFLRSLRGLRIDHGAGVVQLSSIFKWFGEDFVKTYGTSDKFTSRNGSERAVLNFVSRYVDESDQDFLLRGDYKIEYLNYDWSLNEQTGR